ncbi:hypothetical protein PVAP13_9NG552300 [Panicum virgatum]|uniref:Uncharacterized protein n=1 Tax=Panicum virgatum TaxID=38727 RepID=A0A8T0MUL7_PANVG|nr:hypothetical protein PVAP13_9NG552300 [Panicum virgatum]KAG2540419.1 hypothetical protein PVAP13_9NG552300 [Panicum virgatum]
MVKTDYRDLCGLHPSHDVLHRSPSSPSDVVDSSENEMDPSNISVTPDSGGSGSDDNGGSSMHTSSCRRRLMLSFPTGTQLATADGRGSGSSSSSSSSVSPDLDSHSLLLVSPACSPAATDDDVLIMDGALVDNEPSSPSSARRPVSFNSLVLVSSGSQGTISVESSGGSGGRRSGSNGQITHREEPRVTQAQRNRHSEVGSPHRHWQHQGAGLFNINQGQEFFNPFNNNRGQDFINPFNIQHGPAFPIHFPYYYGQWLPGAPYYTYAPSMVAIHPTELYGGVFDIRRHPPSGVNITHPDGTPLQLPQRPPTLPQPPRGSRVLIAPPPAPEQPVTQPPLPPAPEQAETLPQPPAMEHPETPPPPPQESSAQTLHWPPTAEEAAAIEDVLYGPSARKRLPVFKEICPDDDANQTPPPASPCP